MERKKHHTNKSDAEDLKNLVAKISPEIKPELVRKYVAYAKRHISPVMSEKVREYISYFYVDSRTPKSNDSPLIITPRQLEGIERLAEAAARMELSDVVTVEHAVLAINMMNDCFKIIAKDPDTGLIDIDILESGISRSQREKFQAIKLLIFEMAIEYEKLIPIEKLIEKAKLNNIEQSTVEKQLKKLKEIGEIFYPKEGYISPS
jgi:replicative DNA helicase Mcm